MRNRRLRVAGVFLSDVAKALERNAIPLTESNLKGATTYVELAASDAAKRCMQVTSKENWLDMITLFQEKGE